MVTENAPGMLRHLNTVDRIRFGGAFGFLVGFYTSTNFGAPNSAAAMMFVVYAVIGLPVAIARRSWTSLPATLGVFMGIASGVLFNTELYVYSATFLAAQVLLIAGMLRSALRSEQEEKGGASEPPAV